MQDQEIARRINELIDQSGKLNKRVELLTLPTDLRSLRARIPSFANAARALDWRLACAILRLWCFYFSGCVLRVDSAFAALRR